MRIKIFFIISCLFFIPLITHAQTTNLPVPFVSETPDGVWVAPWNNACEEATIVMIEQYYLGQKTITKNASKNLMRPLFSAEDKLFDSNADTNSSRIQTIVNDFTTFHTISKTNPKLDDIKTELDAGHPVISLHYGFDLKNPLIPFLRTGSSYHVMVITGYDDDVQEFIVNDPAVTKGLDFRYNYDIFLNSLHDFNHTTGKADGPARVLFTRFNKIIQKEGNKRTFLVRNNIKYQISSPDLMQKYGWKWRALRILPTVDFDALLTGPTIVK